MRMFITLTFSVHNTYFNTLIKIQYYKPSWGFGSCHSHYWGNLKILLCHVLILPIQHMQKWISCQNHKHKCNWLLAPLSFLCMYVAY